MEKTYMDKFPYISTMVVVRNEENYIEKCISSLLEQDYPKNRYEIILIDGESTDNTVKILKETCKAYEKRYGSAPEYSVLNNPKRILASGWNIGIKQARGEYVVRIDAHAYVEPDFLRLNLKTMLEIDDASCIGGAMTTLSDSSTGELIKEALSSPFGVGGSKFRYAKEAGYVDTVAYGMYKKAVFEKIGYFNEKLVRTQDNDLHRRMRDAGMKFYLNPSIHSYYYSRNTFKKLSKQQFNNGKWTMINFLMRPGKMSIRHFVPLAFVCSLLTTTIGGVLNEKIWMFSCFEIALHLIVGFYFAVKRTHNIIHRIALPFVFLLMHISYGCGSIIGIFSVPKDK